MRPTNLVLFMVSGALAVGCAASSADGYESSEDEYRVKPGGSNTPSYLNVSGPSTPGLVTPSYFGLEGEGTPHPLGATAAYPDGAGRVKVRSQYLNGWISSEAPITLATGKTVQLQAGGVRFSPSSTSPETFLGDGVKLTAGGSTSPTSTISLAAPSAQFAALLPGTYRLSYGVGDGLSFEVKPGVNVDVDPFDYSRRFVRKIIAPAARELPTAGGTDVFQYTCDYVQVNIELKDGASVEVGRPADSPHKACQIRHRAWHLPFLVTFNQQGGPVPMQLGRIDVDDVDVKNPDGTTTKVRGLYSVDVSPGVSYTDLLPTNTGVDMPSGHYRIRVQYTTPHEGTKYTSYDVDI